MLCRKFSINCPPQSDPHNGTKKVQNNTLSQHITSYNTPHTPENLEADATPVYVEKILQSRQKSQQPYTHAPLPQTEDGRKYLLLPCRHHKKWGGAGGVAVFYRKKYISGDPCTRNFATTSEIYKGLIFEFASSHKIIKHTACN